MSPEDPVQQLTGLRIGNQNSRTLLVGFFDKGKGICVDAGTHTEMGKLATVGLAPAIFGPLMNITGSSLASWWREKPVVNEAEKNY